MELFGIGFVIALVVIGLLVYMIVRLTAQRDVERTKAENYARQMNEMKDAHALQLKQAKDDFVHQLQQAKDDFAHQLQQTKEAHEQQIAALKEMNDKQTISQLDLIKDQMQTTSEKVLKMRQEELGAQNKEQVSKIIDPLQRSLKDMQ
jgi:DNA recombination protein RmuC